MNYYSFDKPASYVPEYDDLYKYPAGVIYAEPIVARSVVRCYCKIGL